MKILLHFLALAIICSFISSCCGETCSSGYEGTIKIDGKKGTKFSVKYIGPDKRKYKQEFGFNNTENFAPYFNEFHAFTICKTKHFQKNNYNFLEIKNLGNDIIYICVFFMGAEIDEHSKYAEYSTLLEIYNKQDENPNYDYSQDNFFKNTKLEYINRYDFYQKLKKEKYPYFIELQPNKTCIVKWNNLGIQVL